MRVNRRVSLTLALGGALAWTGVGCGGGDATLPREAVSGTVIFEGKPLAQGSISFMPTTESEGGSATPGTGIIADGKYSIAKADGIIPGNYKVFISSAPPGEAVDMNVPPGEPAPPPKNIIPAKYNTATTLTAEIKPGDNVVDFDLKK